MEPPCKNCGETRWLSDTSRGEYSCEVCGMVLDEIMIDTSLERRNFSDSVVNHERTTSSNAYLSELSSISIIGKSTEKRKTVVVTGDTLATFTHREKEKEKRPKKLMTIQQIISAQDSLVEQHLSDYFQIVETFCRLLNLEGRVADQAKEYLYRYEQAVGKKKKRTLPLDAGVLCAIQLACSKLRTGRTLSDMCIEMQAAEISVYEHEVWDARKKLVRQVPGIDIPVRAEDVIGYFSSMLDLPPIVAKIAQCIRERAQEHVEGRSPETCAAGYLALACEVLELSFNKSDLAMMADIVQGTLQGFCRLVKKELEVLVLPHKLREITQEYKRKN